MFDLYTAGPFFNPAQLEVAEWLEETCDGLGLTYFSPRLHCTELPLDRIPEMKEKDATYRDCYDGIRASRIVLANLDWLLPEGQRLSVVERGWIDHTEGGFMIHNTVGSTFHASDPGTMQEIGFCDGIGKGVIGYVMEHHPHYNLMQAQSCMRILSGREEIEEFLTLYAKAEDKVSYLNSMYTPDNRWKGPVF